MLTLPTPPQELLDETLLRLEGLDSVVEWLCIQKRVSENVVALLLKHGDARISSAAAKGEWFAASKGRVREALQKDWETVVINQVDDDYMLSNVLKSNPALAHRWLLTRLKRQPRDISRYEKAAKVAVDTLDIDARRNVLHHLPPMIGGDDLVAHLIGDNLELYLEILRDSQLQQFHLIPLSWTLNLRRDRTTSH